MSFPRRRESGVMKDCYVYILASERNGTLYIGVTSDLIKRAYQHKEGLAKGFTKKYKVKKLVWFDTTNSIEVAITKEKQMKKWNRKWKIREIEEKNPEWKDLYEDLIK